MLFDLLPPLEPFFGALRVVRDITVRTAAASLTALAISLVLGPWMIAKLRDFQIGQVIRQEGPQSHRAKAGTPTMGGLLILTAAVAPTLLWADLSNPYVWIAVLATSLFGAVGFVDDYLKIVRRSHHGLRPRYKMGFQILIAIGVGLALMVLAANNLYNTRLIFPFFKNLIPDLGWFYVLFAVLVLVGASNAVNLTDGLDGLAIMPAVLVAGALGVFAYATGNAVFSNYLGIPFIEGTGEVLVFCATLVGAGLGFLWFNTYPAQVFMGDIGALALGAALGIVAVIVRQEIVLFVMGGIFVLETVSVMLQVASFKLTGKRIFKMAPIHHHFELKGWAEPKVIVRFWIISVILVLIGLATLKVR